MALVGQSNPVEMPDVKSKNIKPTVKVKAPRVKTPRVKTPRVKRIQVSPATRLLGLVQSPHPLLDGGR